MRDADGEAFEMMLSAVSAIYGRELSRDILLMYWSALAEYDIAAVRQAFDRHVKNPDTGQFMPKPADLIRMIGGTTEDAAMIAWAKVARAIRLIGSWDDVVFDDLLIHRVIEDMGGWVLLCSVLEDELPFKAREFEKRYRGYAMRREVPECRTVLIGRANAENAAKGFPLLEAKSLPVNIPRLK